MFMFGVSVNPLIRLALGLVVLVVGIALHKVVADAVGAVLLIWAGAQWLQRSRSAQ